MSTPFSVAANAYGVTQKIASAASGGMPAATPAQGQGPDFAAMLGDAINGVVETGKASERMGLDLVNGRANVVDMVTAVSETEMAIESMVAVRDKVIAAYEEIMRMPI